MTCSVTIQPGNIISNVKHGKNLLELLHEEGTGFPSISAPCGGKGLCGKCIVRVDDHDGGKPISDIEKKHLSPDMLKEGYRLACLYRIESDITVYPVQDFGTENRPSAPKIMTDLQDMPSGSSTADTVGEEWVFAVDLGTTTIVVYLLNRITGSMIQAASEINSQNRFGADVISRISYTDEHEDGLKLLQKTVVDQLETMMLNVLTEHNLQPRDISRCCIAGNNTMLHLLAGINPISIARYPYNPVFTEMKRFDRFPPMQEQPEGKLDNCETILLPSVSGYVGADITAGILAVNMHESEKLSLLIDIGTNGEMVLGSKEGLYSCATAAGPAFEGFHISCGIGGVSGAIDSVSIIEKGDDLGFTTIDDAPVTGICGSGIVDLAAVLLKAGIIDTTGRFVQEQSDGIDAQLWQRLRPWRGKQRQFTVCLPAPDENAGRHVSCTQQDIREIQLAKSAIAAGIEVLLEKTGHTEDEIEQVFLAGGFGNYIRKESAVAIGLLPELWVDRIVPVGNSAGKGALQCALQEEALDICEKIAAGTTYIELSTEKSFTKKMMQHIHFPTDQPGTFNA